MIKRVIPKYKYEFIRRKNFKIFNKNINYKYAFKKNMNFGKINNYFDYFIVGSDQVWNPRFYKDMFINMLGFVEKKEKKIAVSPSISIDKLSNEEKKEFQKYLYNFKALSCREEKGTDIIKDLGVSENVITLIDPTLVVSTSIWDTVSKRPFFEVPSKYILLYFLGNITDEYEQIITKIAVKYGLKIINLLDKKSEFYGCGPSEFIYLIKNSSIVLTDSFHGSVFAYLYDKPLKIFKRNDLNTSMNSRLINLINILHIDEDVYLNSSIDLNTIFNVKYDKKYLELERKKFLNYIQDNLN